jgi:hypothetical protein
MDPSAVSLEWAPVACRSASLSGWSAICTLLTGNGRIARHPEGNQPGWRDALGKSFNSWTFEKRPVRLFCRFLRHLSRARYGCFSGDTDGDWCGHRRCRSRYRSGILGVQRHAGTPAGRSRRPSASSAGWVALLRHRFIDPSAGSGSRTVAIASGDEDALTRQQRRG